MRASSGLANSLRSKPAQNVRSRAGEDDDADAVIGRPFVERVGDRVAHRDGERIAALLVVETQDRNAVGVDVGRQHRLSLECLLTA